MELLISLIFGEVCMPVIRQNADFSNSYADISDLCHKYREPVFITKDGEDDIAVMSMETYEEITGRRALYNLLDEALADVKNGNFLTEEEMDREMDLM
jgi:PHD/YefM family antitoxin component YafN of YafNO toxin-antitoxin module